MDDRTLSITHTRAEGTVIGDTSRGDGTNEILKAVGWRWSRRLECWYVPASRDRPVKGHLLAQTVAALEAADWTVVVDVDDEPRAAAQVEAARQERARDRAAGLEARTDRLATAAAAAQAKLIRAEEAMPPFGEPIKVGHHSEHRHRRASDRVWTALGRSVEADRAHATAAAKAETAARATEYRHAPEAVAGRIEKLGAESRKVQREIAGYTRNVGGYLEVHRPAEGEHLARLETLQAELADQIAYWAQIRTDQVSAGAVQEYSAENIRAGDRVLVRGTWYSVARVNRVTVRVTDGAHVEGLIAYHRIQQHRPCEEER